MQYCWFAAALIPVVDFPGLRSKRLPDAEFDPHLVPASIITSATPAASYPRWKHRIAEEMAFGSGLACCVAESGHTVGEARCSPMPCSLSFVSMEHAPSIREHVCLAASLLIRRKLICSQNRLVLEIYLELNYI